MSYDPRIGTWISRDLIVDNPYNSYGYVGNDPLNFTDPTGLAKFPSRSISDQWDWHHMLPEKLFAEFGIDIDIHDAKFGYLLPKAKHTGAGGIHPRGWIEDWREFLEREDHSSRHFRKRIADKYFAMLGEYHEELNFGIQAPNGLDYKTWENGRAEFLSSNPDLRKAMLDKQKKWTKADLERYDTRNKNLKTFGAVIAAFSVMLNSEEQAEAVCIHYKGIMDNLESANLDAADVRARQLAISFGQGGDDKGLKLGLAWEKTWASLTANIRASGELDGLRRERLPFVYHGRLFYSLEPVPGTNGRVKQDMEERYWTQSSPGWGEANQWIPQKEIVGKLVPYTQQEWYEYIGMPFKPEPTFLDTIFSHF